MVPPRVHWFRCLILTLDCNFENYPSSLEYQETTLHGIHFTYRHKKYCRQMNLSPRSFFISPYLMMSPAHKSHDGPEPRV